MLLVVNGSAVGFLYVGLWILLLATLGVMTLRKGHWVMFLVGLIIPIFWLIGALIPKRS